MPFFLMDISGESLSYGHPLSQVSLFLSDYTYNLDFFLTQRHQKARKCPLFPILHFMWCIALKEIKPRSVILSGKVYLKLHHGTFGSPFWQQE